MRSHLCFCFLLTFIFILFIRAPLSFSIFSLPLLNYFLYLLQIFSFTIFSLCYFYFFGLVFGLRYFTYVHFDPCKPIRCRCRRRRAYRAVRCCNICVVVVVATLVALQPATHSFWLAILIRCCLYVASVFILFCFVVLFGFVVIASAIVLPHASSLILTSRTIDVAASTVMAAGYHRNFLALIV